jgi:hypothetical protein
MPFPQQAHELLLKTVLPMMLLLMIDVGDDSPTLRLPDGKGPISLLPRERAMGIVEPMRAVAFQYLQSFG